MVLIIPIFNGAAYLPNTFSLISDYIHNNKGLINVVVFVDDGSSDNTYELCLNRKEISGVKVVTLYHSRNIGKGAAIITAFDWCLKNTSEDWFSYTDVELPYGLGILSLQKDFSGCAIIGVRRGSTSSSVLRSVSSKLFRLLVPYWLKNIQDTQCGIKICSRKLAEYAVKKTVSRRWVFDIELLLCAISIGEIQQVPVKYREGFVHGRGGVSIFYDSGRILWDMVFVHIRAFLGKYF